jgi:hypothetical protein
MPGPSVTVVVTMVKLSVTGAHEPDVDVGFATDIPGRT